MKQPSKEEVEILREKFNKGRITVLLEHEALPLIDAYLALREEVERKSGIIKMQDSFIMDKSALAADRLQEINKLEADNKAIHEKLADQRRRMGREYDELLARLTKSQQAGVDEIKRLEADNEALRARLNRLKA